MDADVVIVGAGPAGPAGLMLAAELCLAGVHLTMIAAKAATGVRPGRSA